MSSLHGPYGLGYTRATMGMTKRCKSVNLSESLKSCLSSDCSLEREHKVGIASNRRLVRYGEYGNPILVHTARHATIIGLKQSF